MRPSKVRYREVWSTCYWCRQNFCTMRAWFPGIRGIRKSPKFCGDKCESLSKRWDHIAEHKGIVATKYRCKSLYSLFRFPCGHERIPANTRSHAGKTRCKPCGQVTSLAHWHRKETACSA